MRIIQQITLVSTCVSAALAFMHPAGKLSSPSAAALLRSQQTRGTTALEAHNRLQQALALLTAFGRQGMSSDRFSTL